MIRKKDLVKMLSQRKNLSLRESKMIVDELFDIMEDVFLSEEDINIVGFGKFFLYEHAPRAVRNPKTKENMVMPIYKSCRFRPSPELKEALRKKTQK